MIAIILVVLMPVITFFCIKAYRHYDEQDNATRYHCLSCDIDLRERPSKSCKMISHWSIFCDHLNKSKMKNE
jgi:hypothetical protein